MPELEGLLAGSLGHAGEEHAGVHGEVVVVALVDDAARHAAVHPQREVLADAEELHGVVQYSTMQYSTMQYSTVQYLHGVVLAVVEDLVAEHRAHGVVAHVVGHADAAPAHNMMLWGVTTRRGKVRCALC